MNMKVMTAREAKNSFGLFIDTAQREPVLITKRRRPMGMFISIQEIENIPELKDNILKYMEKTTSSPLLSMMGSNKNHPSFTSAKEADQFIQKLRNEWK